MVETEYLPSREVLQSVFEYDTATGDLRWRRRADMPDWWNSRNAGVVAGGKPDHEGYLRVEFRHDGRRVRARAHRIAFKLLTGVEPEMVDHRHGVEAGNAAANLREANAVLNRWNSSRRKGRVLPKHVLIQRGRIGVEMVVAGTRYRRSGFGTVEEAEKHAVAMAKQLQGEFSAAHRLLTP